MAVSSKFTQKSLFGGGSTKSNTPKIDTSYGANLGGGQQNNIVNLPTLSGGGNSGGLTAANENVLKKTLGNTPTVTIPQNLTYQNNLKNMTGIIGQGGASGGVTDEGVIVGNPNVEKMPTINRNGSSAHQFTTFGQLVDETGKDLTSYAANGIGGDTSVQESVLRRGTPEWDAVMNSENKRNLPYMIDQNSEGTAGDGAKTTYAAYGISGDTGGGTPPTDNSGTGSTGSTGGSTTGSGEVDTYEEFLLKQEGLYKQQYEDLLAQIEAERQRGVIDARSSYEQNKATYGANAEQLAAMGLSGSGYSDYLNQQAYATQRAETQGANAQAESNRLQAELSYTENMMNLEKDKIGLEEQKKQYYAALLTSANTGDYTAEQLAELGKQYGLSEEQITSITDAANTYKTNTQKSNYSNLMIDVENRATNKTILDTALKNDNISQEQYNDLLSRYQTNTYDDYSSVINTDFSQADTSVIDNAYNRGEITKTQYNNLKTQYNKGVANAITAASLFYSNGAALDSSTAKAIVDKLVSTGWLTQDTKNKINNAYDQAYNTDDGGGCYAKGTMITVADGTQKAVEDIKVGDSVLVFNHLTGELDVSPISYVFHDGEKEYEVLKLQFDDAADVEVLFEHGFFDVDSKEYVLINPENAKDFVGHRFYRVTAKNGAYDKEIVTLTDYQVYTSQTECYAVVTAGHINSFANGMLSVTDDIKGLYNIFALDEDMKYDAQKMEEDIQKYGLFSYEDWKDFVSEEEFAAFNGAFLKVSIGKGLVTQDEIVGYIDKFLKQ